MCRLNAKLNSSDLIDLSRNFSHQRIDLDVAWCSSHSWTCPSSGANQALPRVGDKNFYGVSLDEIKGISDLLEQDDSWVCIVSVGGTAVGDNERISIPIDTPTQPPLSVWHTKGLDILQLGIKSYLGRENDFNNATWA